MEYREHQAVEAEIDAIIAEAYEVPYESEDKILDGIIN